MNKIETDKQLIHLDEHGFLVERDLWNHSIANHLAQTQGLILTEEHLLVINFCREFYEKYQVIPSLRIFIKNLKMEYGEDIANSQKLHELFPESPLKLICLIGGLPKPKHCM